MKRFPSIAVAIIAAVTVTALSAGGGGKLKIKDTYDRDASFEGLRTYAWMEAEETSPRDPRLANIETDRRIRSVVDRELERRGYGKTDAAEASFLVKYHALLEGAMDTKMLDSSYGAGPGWSYDGSWVWSTGMSGSYIKKYKKGTLVLDIVDPTSEALIWRSSAQAKVHTESSPEDRERRLANAVSKMLERFPPKTD